MLCENCIDLLYLYSRYSDFVLSNIFFILVEYQMAASSHSCYDKRQYYILYAL